GRGPPRRDRSAPLPGSARPVRGPDGARPGAARQRPHRPAALSHAVYAGSIAKQQVDTQEALVRQYEGTVKADQGQVDNVRLQLTYSRITAPISGRLGLRLVDAGNIVRAGDANGLVVITQLQPISVLFTITQD